MKKYDVNDPSTYIDRKLDYYLKGLTGVESSTTMYWLDQIGYYNVKCLSESEENYPTLRKLGFSDTEIERYKLLIAEKFKDVNRHVAKFNRAPLFPDPDDVDASVKLYKDLLKNRPYEELVEFFGVTYENYQPVELNKQT